MKRTTFTGQQLHPNHFERLYPPFDASGFG